jgi:hypothetical protein
MDDHNSPRATRWYEFRDRMIREHASGGCVHFGAGAFGTILAAAFDAGMEAERAARPSVPEEGPEALREALTGCVAVMERIEWREGVWCVARCSGFPGVHGSERAGGTERCKYATALDAARAALAVPESGGRP